MSEYTHSNEPGTHIRIINEDEVEGFLEHLLSEGEGGDKALMLEPTVSIEDSREDVELSKLRTSKANSSADKKHFDVRSFWLGKGSRRLGLSGEVNDDFEALCSGRNPRTKKKLGKFSIEGGSDLIFDVPKSLSIYLSKNKDQELERIIEQSCVKVIEDLERRSGREIVCACYVHGYTTIEVESYPRYHVHCFTFVIGFNPATRTWGNFYPKEFLGDPLDHDRYLESLLVEAGYDLRRTGEGFELSAVSDGSVKLLERRIEMIEEYVKKKYPILEARARKLMEEKGDEFEAAFHDAQKNGR
jgi:hypothetical protein